MKEIVTLRLDVEGLKHQMIHAFSKHSLEIEEQIKKACDNFLNSGELYLAVEREFYKAVNESIKNYFSYGEGSRLVKEIVEKLLSSQK